VVGIGDKSPQVLLIEEIQVEKPRLPGLGQSAEEVEGQDEKTQ
jgi:hypothetical protein